MLKEQLFDSGVVQINYAEGSPSGSPLVLLHGGGGRWQIFLPIIPHLSIKWHVFALDLRGHGKSGRISEQYRPEDYAVDIIKFLQNPLNEPAVIFGYSLGGLVALIVAAQIPDRVRAIIVGDSPISMEHLISIESSEDSRSFYSTIRDLINLKLSVKKLASALGKMSIKVEGKDKPILFKDRQGVDDAYLLNYAKSLSQADPDALMFHAKGKIKEYVENINMNKILDKISCPVLLLQADPSFGGHISDSDVEHVLSKLSNAFHIKFEHVGHSLGLNTWNVTKLLRVVTNFLESL